MPDNDPDDTNPRHPGPFRSAYGPPTPEEIDAYLARVRRALYGDTPPPLPRDERPRESAQRPPRGRRR